MARTNEPLATVPGVEGGATTHMALTVLKDSEGKWVARFLAAAGGETMVGRIDGADDSELLNWVADSADAIENVEADRAAATLAMIFALTRRPKT